LGVQHFAEPFRIKPLSDNRPRPSLPGRLLRRLRLTTQRFPRRSPRRSRHQPRRVHKVGQEAKVQLLREGQWRRVQKQSHEGTAPIPLSLMTRFE
jgi:hypothetical protein